MVAEGPEWVVMPVVLPLVLGGLLKVDETGIRRGTLPNDQYATPITAITMTTLTATAIERFIPMP